MISQLNSYVCSLWTYRELLNHILDCGHDELLDISPVCGVRRNSVRDLVKRLQQA